MAAAGTTTAGDGLACDDAGMEVAKAALSDAGFSSAMITMIKTLCQNYVFTTEQVAELVGMVGMSDDKLEALKAFEGHVTNPSEGDVVVEVFSFDSDKEAAAAVLAGFSPASVGTLAVYSIEDDGHRSEEDMARLLGAVEAEGFSSGKVDVVKAEVAEHPNPPLDAAQLISLLKLFGFSSDAISVLEAFAGPALVYPMPCTDIVGVLEVFGMSSDRLEVLPALKPFIADPQNKLAIVSSFSFSSDKEKAEEILRDVVVRLQPKEPPMAAVQEALKRVGCCPSGYAWRQVSGGWRCAAGGHYVSDEALAAAM